MAARRAAAVLAGLVLVTGASTTADVTTDAVATTLAATTLAPTTTLAATTTAATLAPATTEAATTQAPATTEAATTLAPAATTMAPTTAAAATTTVAGASTTVATTTAAGDTTTLARATAAPTTVAGATAAPTTVAPATTLAPSAASANSTTIAAAATTTTQRAFAALDAHPNLLGSVIYPMPTSVLESLLRAGPAGIAAHFNGMQQVSAAVKREAGVLAGAVSTRFILKLKYSFAYNFAQEPSAEVKVRAYDAAKSLACTLPLIMAGKCSLSLMAEDLTSLRAAVRGGLRRLQAPPAYNLTMAYGLNVTEAADAAGLTLPTDSSVNSQFLNMTESILDAQLPGQNVKDNLVAVSKPVVTAETLVQVLAEEDTAGADYNGLQARVTNPAPLTTAFAFATNSTRGEFTPTVDLCHGRDCGGRGVCVHGTCLCSPGWSRPNCLIALNITAPAPSSAVITSLGEAHPWPWAVVIGLLVITLLAFCALCAWAVSAPEVVKKEQAMVDQTVIEKTFI